MYVGCKVGEALAAASVALMMCSAVSGPGGLERDQGEIDGF
jgi:hypothetical protein